MLRYFATHPGTRIILALFVSVVLHLAIFSLSGYWQGTPPPPPKPENWKFDVTVAPHGEGLSRKQDAPATQQKTTTQAKGEKTQRVKSRVLAKVQRKAVAPEAAESHANLAVTAEAVKPPPAAQPPVDAQKQAEALAGAMANLANMQFMLGQMKVFSIATRAQIKSAIAAKFTEENLMQYAGAICMLKLDYAVPANTDFKVDCGERHELATALASQIDWRTLPQPGKFFLNYRTMNITLWFEGYQVRVGLTPGG